MSIAMSVYDFFDLLAGASTRATLLVSLVLVITYFGRSLPPHPRHSLWFAASTACIALPLFMLVLPSVRIPLLPDGLSDSSPVAMSTSPALQREVASRSVFDLWAVFATIYALGVFFVFARFVRALFRIFRLQHSMCPAGDPRMLAMLTELAAADGIRRPISLLLSNHTDSPMTWGASRPRIALPADAPDWPEHRLRNALLHEIHHIARCDWLRLWVLQLAVALHWFNPLVWIAMRQCRFEAERACDEYVLKSGGDSADYAEQLVEIMTNARRTSPEAGLALGNKHFMRRVRAVLNASTETIAANRFREQLLPVAVFGLAVLLAACQMTTAQDVEEGPASVAREPRTAEPFEVYRLEGGQAVRLEAIHVEGGQAIPFEVARDAEESILTPAGGTNLDEIRLAQVGLEENLPPGEPSNAPDAEEPPAPDKVLLTPQRRALAEAELALREQRLTLAKQEVVLSQYRDRLHEQQRAVREQENALRELTHEFERMAQRYKAERVKLDRRMQEAELQRERAEPQSRVQPAGQAAAPPAPQPEVQAAPQPEDQPRQWF